MSESGVDECSGDATVTYTLERRVLVRLGLLDTVAVSLPALVLWV